jgi:hypothetical protein
MLTAENAEDSEGEKAQGSRLKSLKNENKKSIRNFGHGA